MEHWLEHRLQTKRSLGIACNSGKVIATAGGNMSPDRMRSSTFRAAPSAPDTLKYAGDSMDRSCGQFEGSPHSGIGSHSTHQYGLVAKRFVVGHPFQVVSDDADADTR